MLDPYFLNPPEPSCSTCRFWVVSEVSKTNICNNFSSRLYGEHMLPGDWCINHMGKDEKDEESEPHNEAD